MDEFTDPTTPDDTFDPFIPSDDDVDILASAASIVEAQPVAEPEPVIEPVPVPEPVAPAPAPVAVAPAPPPPAAPEPIPWDLDGDGEAQWDTDGDGAIDFVERDLDGDGVIDEQRIDLEFDGQMDHVGVDTTHDGLADQVQAIPPPAPAAVPGPIALDPDPEPTGLGAGPDGEPTLLQLLNPAGNGQLPPGNFPAPGQGPFPELNPFGGPVNLNLPASTGNSLLFNFSGLPFTTPSFVPPGLASGGDISTNVLNSALGQAFAISQGRLDQVLGAPTLPPRTPTVVDEIFGLIPSRTPTLISGTGLQLNPVFGATGNILPSLFAPLPGITPPGQSLFQFAQGVPSAFR